MEEVRKLRGGETRKTRRTRDGLTNSHKHTLQGFIALVVMWEMWRFQATGDAGYVCRYYFGFPRNHQGIHAIQTIRLK